MQYEVRQPHPALAGAVDYMWTLRDAPAHGRERIVPSGTVELVINLAADGFEIHRSGTSIRLPGAIVSGCYSTAFEIETRNHAAIIGVHFKPGGAVALGVSPGDLADSHASLEDLWGKDAVTLREQLCEATIDERFALIESALLGRRRVERDVVAVARAALDRPGVQVGDVARLVQLSRRRLIEIFTEDVGMTPKRFARVRRFQRTLAVAARAQSSWAELAAELGYFDQSHLCREWAELTGLTPSETMQLRTIPAKENHIALVKSVQDGRRAHT